MKFLALFTLTILLPTLSQAESTTPSGVGLKDFAFQMIIIIAILYVLVFRPHQVKMKKHAEMLNNLKKGDKIVTSSGIVGVITKNADKSKFAEIEIADNVKIEVLRAAISDIYDNSIPVSKTEVIKAENVDKKTKPKKKDKKELLTEKPEIN